MVRKKALKLLIRSSYQNTTTVTMLPLAAQSPYDYSYNFFTVCSLHGSSRNLFSVQNRIRILLLKENAIQFCLAGVWKSSVSSFHMVGAQLFDNFRKRVIKLFQNKQIKIHRYRNAKVVCLNPDAYMPYLFLS